MKDLRIEKLAKNLLTYIFSRFKRKWKYFNRSIRRRRSTTSQRTSKTSRRNESKTIL